MVDRRGGRTRRRARESLPGAFVRLGGRNKGKAEIEVSRSPRVEEADEGALGVRTREATALRLMTA